MTLRRGRELGCKWGREFRNGRGLPFSSYKMRPENSKGAQRSPRRMARCHTAGPAAFSSSSTCRKASTTSTCEAQSKRKLPLLLLRNDDFRKLPLLIRKEDFRNELSLAWMAAGLKRWLSDRGDHDDDCCAAAAAAAAAASAASSPSGSDSRFSTCGLLCAAQSATSFVTHAKNTSTDATSATTLGVACSPPCAALTAAVHLAMAA